MLRKFLLLIQLAFIGLIGFITSSNMTSSPVIKNVNAAHLEFASPSLSANELITEYSISGSPLNITSSAPNNIWFTMPASNKIGNLKVDASGEPTYTDYTAPTANSEPYDLVYDGISNAIWFTQKAAGQLGRLDINTGIITEINTIPTANSMPTGISIAPDGSIWFAMSNANRLGHYRPSTNEMNETSAYLPTTDGVTNAEFHDVALSESGDKVWVTSPADHQVLKYSMFTDQFSSIPLSSLFDPIAASSRAPYNLETASGDVVWLTDIANNQIGQLFQGTLANVAWYTLPTDASNPEGIAFGEIGRRSEVFFTGTTTNVAGSLTDRGDAGSVPSEYKLPAGSQPRGITMDSNGTVWIAQSGSNKIASWAFPYYQLVYLPIIESN